MENKINQIKNIIRSNIEFEEKLTEYYKNLIKETENKYTQPQYIAQYTIHREIKNKLRILENDIIIICSGELDNF